MLTQLDLRPGMELRVSAAHVLLSELLLLPALELDRRVHAELETNAALELPAAPSCPGCGHPVWSGACLRCERWSLRRRHRPDDRADLGDRLAHVAATTALRDVLLTDAAPALRPADRTVAAQFGVAQEILRDIAPFVRPLCRPAGAVPAQQGLTGVADEWVSVAALLGPQLADGTDLFDAARTAHAWRTVFDWLIDSVEPVDPVVPLPTEVCEAAAILRPTQGRHCRSGCTR